MASGCDWCNDEPECVESGTAEAQCASVGRLRKIRAEEERQTQELSATVDSFGTLNREWEEDLERQKKTFKKFETLKERKLWFRRLEKLGRNSRR